MILWVSLGNLICFLMYQWPDALKCFQLAFNLTETAGTWYSTLPQGTTGNWTNHKMAAFVTQFVNNEPLLVTESKLASRWLQPIEPVDDYLGDILLLGTRLGRAPQ